MSMITSSTMMSTTPPPTGSHDLQIFSTVLGWVYFVAWSLSYYPQIYENWKRKSVIGYSFDLLSLETIDMTLYSVYNIGLYASPYIQEEYMKEHKTDVIPVKLNDLIFAAHAVFCCILIIVQCVFYERGGQTVSVTFKVIIVIMFIFVVSVLMITLSDRLEWIDFLSYLSYVKIITCIKYIPQAFMNFKRKSTSGFSIGLVILDLIGAAFSIAQMILDSYNAHDWSSFTGNPTKLGVGVMSIVFDLVFALQHYTCFRNNETPEILTNNGDEEQAKEQEEEEV